MRVISPAEANELARYIQAMHAYTNAAWMDVLASMTSNAHPAERRRRREIFERQVAEFDARWYSQE